MKLRTEKEIQDGKEVPMKKRNWKRTQLRTKNVAFSSLRRENQFLKKIDYESLECFKK
jgi:hypothetical protein